MRGLLYVMAGVGLAVGCSSAPADQDIPDQYGEQSEDKSEYSGYGVLPEPVEYEVEFVVDGISDWEPTKGGWIRHSEGYWSTSPSPEATIEVFQGLEGLQMHRNFLENALLDMESSIDLTDAQLQDHLARLEFIEARIETLSSAQGSTPPPTATSCSLSTRAGRAGRWLKHGEGIVECTSPTYIGTSAEVWQGMRVSESFSGVRANHRSYVKGGGLSSMCTATGWAYALNTGMEVNWGC